MNIILDDDDKLLLKDKTFIQKNLHIGFYEADKFIKLSRFVSKANDGDIVKFLNKNKNDFRKSNLIVTKAKKNNSIIPATLNEIEEDKKEKERQEQERILQEQEQKEKQLHALRLHKEQELLEIKQQIQKEEAKVLRRPPALDTTPIPLSTFIPKKKTVHIPAPNNVIHDIELTITDSISPVKYIWHISDIHIEKSYHRHKEYLHVFSNLLVEMQKYPPSESLCVITGDIVHDHLELSPEQITLLATILKLIADVMDLIAIPGNHDIIKNKSRMDSLSPVIDLLNHPKITYLKNSGIYKLNRLCNNKPLYIYHTSVMNWIPGYGEKFDKFLDGNDGTDSFKLCLLHGSLANDRFKDGCFAIKENGEPINLDDLQYMDLVCLGDIHRPTFLKDNIAYAGSLLQRDLGEFYEHGAILWNTEQKKGTFIPIKNEYGYIDYELTNNRITLHKQNPCLLYPIKARITLCDEVSQDMQRALNSELLHKYPNIKIEIQKKYIDNNVVNDIETDLTEYIDFKNKFVSGYDKYLKGTDLEIYHRVELIKTHERMANKMCESIGEFKYWAPILLEAKNCLVYKSLKFNFAQYHGTLGLVGDNRSGKTSLLNILEYAVYGDCSRKEGGITYADFMRYGENEFRTDVILTTGNRLYQIKRWVKKEGPMYKCKEICFYELKQTGDNEYEVCNTFNIERKQKETENEIQKILGSHSNFADSCLFLGNKDIINKSPSERYKYVINKIGYNYQNFSDAINNEMREFARELDYKNLATNIRQLEILKADIDKALLSDDIQPRMNEINNEINTLEKEQSKLLERKQIGSRGKIIVQQDYDRRNALKTQVIVDDYDSCILELRCQINKIQVTIDTHKQRITLLENENDELQSRINQSDNKPPPDITELKLNLLKEQLLLDFKQKQFSTELPYNKRCKTCTTRLEQENEIKNNLKNEIEQHSQNIANLNYDIAQINASVIDFIPFDQSGIEETMRDNQKEIDDLNDVIQDLSISLDTYNMHLSVKLETKKIYDEYNQLNNDIIGFETKELYNEIHTMINKLRAEREELLKITYQSKYQIMQATQNIQELEKKIDIGRTIEGRLMVLTIYRKHMLLENGYVEYFLKSIFDRITQRCNSLLKYLGVTDFTIDMSVEKKNLGLYIKIVDEHRTQTNIEFGSGFEKFVVNMIIKQVLNNCSKNNMPSVIFIDEGFGVLDETNRKRMEYLFKFMKECYDFIFVISHIHEIIDFMDHQFKVTKEPNNSTIEYIKK